MCWGGGNCEFCVALDQRGFRAEIAHGLLGRVAQRGVQMSVWPSQLSKRNLGVPCIASLLTLLHRLCGPGGATAGAQALQFIVQIR